MPSKLPPEELKYEIAHIKDDRRGDIIAACATCIAAAIIAVILRLLARRLSKAKILADDYMIIVALVFCMGQVATLLYTVHLGAGRHVILLKNVPAYAKAIISQEVFYCVATSVFKWSALLLYHRIFGSVKKFTIVLWIVAAVIFANNFAEIFLSIFQCNPIRKAWDQELEGSCVNILLAAPIPGAINVGCDVVTVLLPIPMIWNLHMRMNRKIQLVGIFLLSGFVCIASTYRTIVVKRLSHKDASWADVDPAIWAIVENAIGIVSASLPTMRPIYSFLVRGHHCSTTDKQCSRCSASKSKSSKSNPTDGSGSGTYNYEPKQMGRDRNQSYPSVVESVDKGGKVTTFEMC
ncbi:hypothetical protein ACLMJK_008046 [Lecanora helva]